MNTKNSINKLIVKYELALRTTLIGRHKYVYRLIIHDLKLLLEESSTVTQCIE